MHFVYLCPRSFADLTGHDPLVRRCDECQTEVLDLDRMTPAEQAEWFALLDRVGELPCVTMRVPPAEGPVSCQENPQRLARHMTGRVALPTAGEAFRQELRSYPDVMAELQRRYREVEPRRQALLQIVRQRARGA
jgi:hypothetical protein